MDEIQEHGVLMSGGGIHVRSQSQATEDIYPLTEWIINERRAGTRVFRRRIRVIEDWEEIFDPLPVNKRR